ncbi:MAG: PDZ domain-containing protein, partial [Nitrospinaceae bacterium]
FISEDVAQVAKIGKNDGVLVNSVFKDQPASKAGIKVGDIILKIGGATVSSPNSMIRLIGNISPGQTINLDILRNGERKAFSVQLVQKKDPKRQLAMLEKKKPIQIGLVLENLNSAAAKNQEAGVRRGVVVAQVLPHSKAEKQGIRVGDVITEINGKPIDGKQDFENFLQDHSHNPFTLLIDRDNVSILFKLNP